VSDSSGTTGPDAGLVFGLVVRAMASGTLLGIAVVVIIAIVSSIGAPAGVSTSSYLFAAPVAGFVGALVALLAVTVALITVRLVDPHRRHPRRRITLGAITAGLAVGAAALAADSPGFTVPPWAAAVGAVATGAFAVRSLVRYERLQRTPDEPRPSGEG